MDFLTEQLELDEDAYRKSAVIMWERLFEDAKTAWYEGNPSFIGHVGKWIKLAAGVM